MTSTIFTALHSRFARAALGAAVLTATACGGAVTTEGSNDPQGNAQNPGDTVTPVGGDQPVTKNPPAPPTTGGDALEYFHRGAANLAIDHQRVLFAIHQRVPGSDSIYNACGSFVPRDQGFAVGTRLELLPGAFYPSSFGGGIAVKDVRVQKLDASALVVHVIMVNGDELDDTWERGLGTQCEGDCIPNLGACSSLAKK